MLGSNRVRLFAITLEVLEATLKILSEGAEEGADVACTAR
jgi:hypothetical protein